LDRVIPVELRSRSSMMIPSHVSEGAGFARRPLVVTTIAACVVHNSGARCGSMSKTKEGVVLWFTGLSGAGKSTLAEALIPRLRGHGRRVELFDGDVVRTHLSKGLGFSREDRDTNIARIAFVAHLLARNGVTVVVAAISPFRQARERARALIGHFVE